MRPHRDAGAVDARRHRQPPAHACCVKVLIERPPELLIASGVLAREAGEVARAFGLREQRAAHARGLGGGGAARDPARGPRRRASRPSSCSPSWRCSRPPASRSATSATSSSTRSTARPASSPTSASSARWCGDALVDVVTTEVRDDWEERWRHWHRPLDVGPLRVRPPWEPARDGALDVVIDPGQAFGTGAHPSTRLTLELLLEVPAEGALADWGCGSGVLAIAAARLGFAPVLACDDEEAAVAADRRGGGRQRRDRRGLALRPAARRPARGRRPSPPTSCGRCCSRSRRGWSGRRSG